jgi:hypothetical protein
VIAKLCITVAKLSEYAQRGNDQDTTVSSFNELVGKAETLYKELNTATAFFTPEVTKLSEKQIVPVSQFEYGKTKWYTRCEKGWLWIVTPSFDMCVKSDSAKRPGWYFCGKKISLAGPDSARQVFTRR